MAPSRGLTSLLQARVGFQSPRVRRFSSLVQTATNPSNKSQIYISRSFDPYLNLSIEHYLLQNTPPDSTVLFLYTNRRSVIIGRNQNPWVETHIPSLKHIHDALLVRRRSGGGTVFHDQGNVNYSVICPTTAFNRDKHAEMVVRALHKLGIGKARVNERHDIVVDGIKSKTPFKVSGSAYKLTRLRSLHHGTCLLSSPNIEHISKMLWSPAKRYIKARGVDSVSSPVANVGVSNDRFEDAVVAEFIELYKAGKPMILETSVTDVPEIVKGVEELKSPDWIYSQTPQFTLSSHSKEYDASEDIRKGSWLDVPEIPEGFSADMTIRNGKIIESAIKFHTLLRPRDAEIVNERLLNRTLHEIDDWEVLLSPKAEGTSAAAWMNVMLGVRA